MGASAGVPCRGAAQVCLEVARTTALRHLPTLLSMCVILSGSLLPPIENSLILVAYMSKLIAHIGAILFLNPTAMLAHRAP